MDNYPFLGITDEMLIGEFIHSLDAKKRLAIPARMRGELGNRVIITKGLDKCLFVYPPDAWRMFVEKLNTLSLGQAKARSFVRLFLSGAMEAEFDKLGRILIPDYLRNYAQLQKNVTVLGVFNRIELWDSQRWNVYRQSSEENTDTIAEQLGELGII